MSEEYNVVPLVSKPLDQESRADVLALEIIERTRTLHSLIGADMSPAISYTEDQPTQSHRQLARQLLRERRDRDVVLNVELLGDPAWDMLLDLFVAGEEAKTISVSSLCLASGVPPSTALRWITVLADRDLIVRINDPRDGRRVNISLPPQTRTSLRTYLERTAIRRGIRLVKID